MQRLYLQFTCHWTWSLLGVYNFISYSFCLFLGKYIFIIIIWEGSRCDQSRNLLKNTVFWDVAPCRSCVNRRFGATHRLHLQGSRKIASEKPAWADDYILLTLVPRSRIFLPWRLRRYVPPKRRFTHHLHGATSQKTAFFIFTAVKTSNITEKYTYHLLNKIGQDQLHESW
jgi:hypothetical protein